MDINSQHHNLLGNQIGGFLYFGGHFLFKMATIANQYGAACLTPCKYSFPLKSFHFLIFILAAILKILKTKSTTLSDDLFLCQVSKASAVWSEFNIFCTLVTMATTAILKKNSTPQKLPHYGGYSYKV